MKDARMGLPPAMLAFMNGIEPTPSKRSPERVVVSEEERKARLAMDVPHAPLPTALAKPAQQQGVALQAGTVYLCASAHVKGYPRFSCWDGESWCFTSHEADEAYRRRHTRTKDPLAGVIRKATPEELRLTTKEQS